MKPEDSLRSVLPPDAEEERFRDSPGFLLEAGHGSLTTSSGNALLRASARGKLDQSGSGESFQGHRLEIDLIANDFRCASDGAAIRKLLRRFVRCLFTSPNAKESARRTGLIYTQPSVRTLSVLRK